MSKKTIPNRCRIVLIAPPPGQIETDRANLESALDGGDVASLFLPDYGQDEALFQKRAELLVPMAQERGVAVLLAGSPRIAARVKADGLHSDGSLNELGELIDKYQSQLMVGAGGIKTRDEALERGELQPDYVFFGRFGYDNKPDPHPRNLTLAAWWAQMVEVPCVVLAGSALASLETVAATGADFVATGAAIFDGSANPRERVAEANALLDRTAPQLEEV